MSFSCQKVEFDRFFYRLDRPVEESRPDRQPDRPVDPTGFHLWAQQRRWNTASPHSSTTTSTAVMYAGFWKGRGQKLQKTWEEHRSEFEIVTLKFHPILRPKSGEEQKKKGLHSNFVPFFALNQVKSKKKVLHSNFVPFFAQNHSNFKPKAWKPDAQLAKGGHASICSLF